MPHVLLIDDDDDIIQVNRLALERSGHAVSAARSAQEGWDFLMKTAPDAIVLDVMMEEFNAGFTLAQDINVKFPRIPIVMMTSVREHMNRGWTFSKENDSKWIPVQRFHEKPVKPDQLVKAIDEVIEEATARR